MPPTLDDVIRYLCKYIREQTSKTRQQYGFQLWLPFAVHSYACDELDRDRSAQLSRRDAEQLAPIFLDACWELCRRGILRGSVVDLNHQGTGAGGSGHGYTVTAAGDAWIEKALERSLALPTERMRFVQMFEQFRARLGDGYFQRAREAANCHFATTYLACCAMCGAAAESILLALAIAKDGDNDKVIATYRSASGRRKVENMIVGQLADPLKTRLPRLMDLINYWRDEAAHAELSDISEYEAFEALAMLLRLAHLADDHWDELTMSRPLSDRPTTHQVLRGD